LAAEFSRVERAYRDAGQPLGSSDFWVLARRDGGTWTEHQAHNWREREFRPVVRQVAADFPQFSDLRDATPYATRHSFISCCLQAGISLATIAGWCGTSIQMISDTYGRMIGRYEGASPVTLNEQFQTAKVEAMTLLSASPTTSSARPDGPKVGPAARQGGPTGGPTAGKLPPAKRRGVAV
jgi:hypothetical protein